MGQSYFAADGDDGISKKATPESSQPLSWRGDPRKTYSDWTIVIETGESEFDSKTYHVHKSILSVGPRSSKYFAKLFHEQQYHPSQTTKIELDEQDADSFPIMLDFMYNTSADPSDDASLGSLSLVVAGEDFSTANAVSLRHLARVFDCEGLMLAVNKFIQADLSLQTGPIYLAQAYVYQDDRLVESAKRLCVDNFSQLETNNIIRLPLALFKSLIHSVVNVTVSDVSFTKQEADALSFQLSEVVCQYFEKHPHHLTVDLLLELTDEAIMPKIAPEPAIGFTALARELNSNSIDSLDNVDWKGLVHLCQRCAAAVVGEYGWKDFNVDSALEEFVYGPCAGENGKVDALLFATSFSAALEQAQVDFKALSMSSSSSDHGNKMKSPYAEKVDADVASSRRIQLLERQKQELFLETQEQQDEIERYKSLLDDTKDELLALRHQVKELRRRNLR